MTYRGFGGTAFEPVEESRDREITLGPVMLAVFGLALLALCSVCFVGGYAVGRRQPMPSAPSAQGGPSDSQTASGQPKPEATQSSHDAPPAAQSTAATLQAADAGAAPTADPPAVVQAALPAQPATAQPASTQPNATAAPVQSALPPAGSWMVQIAAVSNEEDADVLMTALRQRGYAIRQRRDPVDNLIHVQVGPFSAENDAIAMRQRLLNDGYNAVIQP